MALWDKCEHTWRLENKDIIKSAWEQLSAAERAAAIVDMKPWMFRSVIVVTYICTVCGTMKTERTENLVG